MQQRRSDDGFDEREAMKYLLAVVLLAMIPRMGLADPVFVAEAGGIRIVLHSEDCRVAEVKNLPRRATWTQDGKQYEGCFGAVPQLGMVMLYFVTDKSVAIVPMQEFQKLQSV
jgi:hypothetical protein